jgi:beta-mannosidase
MGTMYWQLDDCWPGVTWSGIDYYGRWKAMQYFVKEAYKDILVSVHEENDSVKVYVVSDRLQETKGRLSLDLMDFNGASLSSKTPLPPFRKGGREDSIFSKEGTEVIIPSNSSSVYFMISKKDLTQNHSLNDIVFSVKFTDNDRKEYKNIYYFVPPKDLALEDPGLSYKIDNENGDLIISTKKLAKNVHIEINDPAAPLNLENNYFDMLPGDTVHISDKVVIKDLDKGKIKVTSLYDSY